MGMRRVSVIVTGLCLACATVWTVWTTSHAYYDAYAHVGPGPKPIYEGPPPDFRTGDGPDIVGYKTVGQDEYRRSRRRDAMENTLVLGGLMACLWYGYISGLRKRHFLDSSVSPSPPS